MNAVLELPASMRQYCRIESCQQRRLLIVSLACRCNRAMTNFLVLVSHPCIGDQHSGVLIVSFGRLQSTVTLVIVAKKL